ncbi:MAG: glucosyl-3-phosphoglycerate synthase [Methanosarcinaceae archaeon]|nr:glucosyl-3-phosphoglycerate synthase [Methanosarcinaceae archaeon]
MDFFQESITTIHDFCIQTEKMSERLHNLSFVRPVVIIIPMLYEEIENETLPNIINDLNECNCLKKVIIALAADNSSQYEQVLNFFNRLKLPNLVVWCNGPRIQAVLNELNEEKSLDVTSFKGKGKDVWIAVGIASLEAYAIGFHDADIVTYSKALPVKLLYPIVEPELDFFFNKGYYARVNTKKRKMYGRVYRLFVRPMLETLQIDVKYESDILQYLQAFRYTLAGEFALTSDLALNIRIPGDWGLEVGLLAEVYRNTTLKRICQTDLGFYDHKHKIMADNPGEGLCKMVRDILTTFLRIVTETTETQISEAFLHSIRVKYKRFAQDLIRQYHADAFSNGLEYNRHQEERYVDAFTEVIMSTGQEYMKNPSGILLPDWKRALSAMPDLRNKLLNVALTDSMEYKGTTAD